MTFTPFGTTRPAFRRCIGSDEFSEEAGEADEDVRSSFKFSSMPVDCRLVEAGIRLGVRFSSRWKTFPRAVWQFKNEKDDVCERKHRFM